MYEVKLQKKGKSQQSGKTHGNNALFKENFQ